MNRLILSPDIFDYIQTRLDEIERSENIKILLAIESGSRAWGFASPDSDFDVRFIYMHKADWYLSVLEQRDVIECGVDEKMVDLVGWDLRKALRLQLKSNPALYEWLVSPITYRENKPFRQNFRRLFERHANRTALIYHYHSIARTQWKRSMEGRSEVRLKKYFYVIRPLLSLLWLQGQSSLPPMNIEDLLAEISLKKELASAVRRLLETKRRTQETGLGTRIKIIDDWAGELLSDTSFANYEINYKKKRTALEDANGLLQDMIMSC